jgi:hypothetical protein
MHPKLLANLSSAEIAQMQARQTGEPLKRLVMKDHHFSVT